jgi:hypothetical protein
MSDQWWKELDEAFHRGELTADAWTNARAIEGKRQGSFRSCSIGWHGECSSPRECDCPCHDIAAEAVADAAEKGLIP